MDDDQTTNSPDDNESRGDQTRQKLLAAAIDVFGRRGYDGATTRALAEAADVNLQAIPYYFGGKRGLYIAAAEHIAARIAGKLGKTREQAFSRLQGGNAQGTSLSVEDARALLTEILQAMACLFVSQDSEPWARFLIREQMAPTEAFHRIYDGVMEPILGLVRQLVGKILQDDPASEHVRLRTLSLLGSVMVFRVAHAAVMAQLDWKTIETREVALVRDLAAELVASLNSPGAEP